MGAETTLETLAVRLVAEGNQFGRVLDWADQRVMQSAERMMYWGTRMSLALTAPLAGFQTMGIGAFSDFNESIVESTAIMSGVTDEVQAQMEKVAKSISWNSATGPAATGRAYYYLASAGLDAAKSMAALGVVQKFGAAGAFDMARATDLLTDAQSALGLTSKNAQQNMRGMIRLSDVLVQAGNMANASVEQFGVALTNRAGVALRNLNRDVEEGVAALMVYADQGVKGMAGGDQLTMMLRALAMATKRGNAEWKRLGISVYDSSGKMKPLADIFEDLERVLGRLSDEEKMKQLMKLGFMLQSTGAVLPLVGQADKLREYEAGLRSASGATEDVAKKQMTSFANWRRMMTNRLTIAFIDVGKILAPLLQRVGGMLQTGLDLWMSSSDAFKEWAVYLGIGAALAGPFLVMMSKLLPLAFGMWRPLAGIGAGIVGMVIRPFTRVGTVLSTMRRNATSFGSTTVGTLAQVGQGALRAGNLMVQGMGRGWSVGLSGAQRFSSYVAGTVWPRLQSLVSRPLSRGLSQAVANNYAMPIGPIEAAMIRLSARVRVVGTELQYWLTRPLTYFAAAAPGYYAAGINRIRSLTSQTVTYVRQRWDQMSNAVVGYVVPRYQAAAGAIQRRWTLMSSAIAARWDMVSARMSARVAQAQSFLSSVASGVVSRVVAAWNRMPPGVGKAIRATSVLFRQDFAKIQGYIQTTSAIFTRSFLAAGRVAASGIHVSMLSAFSAIRSGAVVTGNFIRSMGGGIFRLLDSASMIVSLAASAGGRLGAIASGMLPLAMLVPALTSVVGIFASWPMIVGAAVAAWGTFTDSGKSFVSWVWSGLQPIWEQISKGIGGVTTALLDGQFDVAGKLAMSTLKSAFFTGMSSIMEKWGTWVRGLTETFLGAVKIIGEAWIQTSNKIAKDLLRFAQMSPKDSYFPFLTSALQTYIYDGANDENGPTVGRDRKRSELNRLRQAQGVAYDAYFEAEANYSEALSAGAPEEQVTAFRAELQRLQGVLAQFEEQIQNVENTSEDAFATGAYQQAAGALEDAAQHNLDQWQQSMDGAIAATNSFLDNVEESAQAAREELDNLLKNQEMNRQTDAYASEFEAYMDSMQTSIDDTATKTDDLQDMLEQPMTATVGLDGAESLEVGSARAARALQEYLRTAVAVSNTKPEATAEGEDTGGRRRRRPGFIPTLRPHLDIPSKPVEPNLATELQTGNVEQLLSQIARNTDKGRVPEVKIAAAEISK